MKIKYQFIIISLFLLALEFNSCKKEDNPSTPLNGSILFHLHTFVDTTEVDNYGDIYILSNGRKITVNSAKLYISNIKLIKLDGAVIDVPSAIIYLRQGVEEYDLGSVPSGNYRTVRFEVGLSDSTNAVTPSVLDLNLNQPSMWFDPTAQPNGFVFINFQGSIDTSSLANGINLIPFVYKIGTNAHRVTITMPDQNFTIAPNQQNVRHIVTDYSKLIEGVQLNVAENLNVSTVAQNAGFPATQIVHNIVTMFHYE